jgi:hypothetical protein
MYKWTWPSAGLFFMSVWRLAMTAPALLSAVRRVGLS